MEFPRGYNFVFSFIAILRGASKFNIVFIHLHMLRVVYSSTLNFVHYKYTGGGGGEGERTRKLYP